MQIKNELLELGNPEVVGKVMGLLGINIDDFKDPVRTSSIMEVMEYIHTVPDPEFFILKACGNKQIDRVDFMRQYISLQKDLKQAEDRVNTINESIKQYEK